MFVQLLKDFLGKPADESIDVVETDAKALIAQQIASPVTDDLITPTVHKAMEQAFAGFQKGLNAVINTGLTQFQTSQSKPRKNDTAIIFGGDECDLHGKCFGHWLVQVAILGNHKASPQAKSAAQDRLDKVYNSAFQPWLDCCPARPSAGFLRSRHGPATPWRSVPAPPAGRPDRTVARNGRHDRRGSACGGP